MKTVLFLGLFLIGCAQPQGPQAPTTPKEPVPDYAAMQQYDCAQTPVIPIDPAKETIMVVGDSTSINFHPALRAALPEYNVVRNPCNAAYSGHAALRIDEYLHLDHYKVVLFNAGIWDLNTPSIDTNHYSENLRKIARAAKAKADRVIFNTTTHTPLDPKRIAAFRAAALKVMAEEGVEVHDLGALSETITDLLRPDGVHFTEAGSEILANSIADLVNQ